MAKTGLGTALGLGLTNNIIAPRSYNGQEEYEKSLVTDKGARTRQILKDGLADVLTFGMGALTNLYSPLGLAAGASAVANRHSAMNNARANYENALNNNLAKYDSDSLILHGSVWQNSGIYPVNVITIIILMFF